MGLITFIAVGFALAFVLYIPFPFAVMALLRRRFLSTVRKSGYTCLTFDDGPCPLATPQILKLLKQNGIKATFFLVGEKAEKHPDLVDMIVAGGHEVGEHGYSHSHPWKCSPLRSATDLIKGRQALKRHQALRNTTCFRPPYGKFNLFTLIYVWITKKQVAFWDVDPKDYREYSGQRVAKKVIDRFRAGSVVLLHDGRNGRNSGATLVTVAATQSVLRSSKKSRLHFATISEALARGQEKMTKIKMIQNARQRVIASCARLFSGNRIETSATRGSLWLGTASLVEQGLRFLRNIILARLLAPEAFGALAIVLAINQAFETLMEIGIQTAIIQNPKGQERTYLNGAWWLAMARAVCLYALACLVAPWVAQFYHNPDLLPLMRVAFLGILFNGAMSPRIYVAIKQMNFKQWVLVHHGAGLVGILSAVLLAFAIRNVWALVLGFTIEAAVRCLLSYLVCPYLPGLSFDRDHLRALFKYVRGVAGLPILTYIFMRIDIFVIGKICSPTELGLYSMAAAISQMPFHFFGAIIAPIAMPTFSAMQTDKAWINEAIMHVTAAIAFLGFPLLLCAALYGKDLLLLVYGAEYTKAAGPFAIIFSSSLLQILCIPVATLYMAIGRPELHRLFAVIRTVSMLVLIYPAVKYFGLTGAAMAGLVSIMLGFLFQVIRMHKITKIDLRRYGLIFLRAVGMSGGVAALWLITHNLYPGRPWLNLLPGAMGCLLAYVLTTMAFLQPQSSFSTFFTASYRKQA